MRKLAKLSYPHYSQIRALISQNLYAQALKSSLAHQSSLLTDQTYALFIKSGHSLDPHLSTSLISHFSKHNQLSRSFSFFLDTRYPDTVTYNALISGFARSDYPVRVFGFFDELRYLGLAPDVFTLSSLVKGCEGLIENRVTHGACLRLGFGSKVFVASGLVENYARNGDVRSAEKCFEDCLEVDNVLYTAMVCGYVWNKEFQKGKEAFMEMRDLGFELNEFSLTGVIGGLFDVREGEQIHGLGVKMGLMFGSSMHFGNSVMCMYSRCGSQMDAVKMFDEIAEPDVVSWTERIGAAFDGEEALELFKALHAAGLNINEYTLINVLSAIGGVKFLKAGKQIQALCSKTGYLQVVSVGNALISMYGKCAQANDARSVFDGMIFRDSVSWNSLIAACSENGLVNEVMELFSQMRDMSMQPSIHTLVSILETLSNSNCTEQVMQIHSHAIKCGFMLDNSFISCLITTYGKCNGMDKSKMVFSDISEPNLVHINAMIITLVHAGYYTDALGFFQTTWSSYSAADSKTFTVALKACGAITDMEQGRAFHSLTLKAGLSQDSFVESAIIDVYCKCGCIDDAKLAFEYTSKDNLAAWNAMIMGYAQHGHCQEVFEYFNKMSDFQMEPDEITYLGILTSCCHTGLVKEARHYLNCMFELHGITPSLEHFACMVDLLGRLGLLGDAKDIIDSMPIEPDVRIWQILLSACNIHGHVELGRVAARKLQEMHPENESAYILLSNLYASTGMWNAVGKLRKEMREKVLQKEPGSSWIQLGGSIHNFLVDDTSHPQNKEIYVELISLYEQMFASAESEQDVLFQ